MRKLLLLIVMAVAVGGLVWKIKVNEKERDGNGELVLFGNVDIRSVDLGFRVGGRLDQMAFEEGDAVRKGDLLAVLDDEPMREEVSAAEAKVKDAEANLDRLQNGARPQEIQQAKAVVEEAEASVEVVQREFDRQKDLLGEGVIARQSYDDVEGKMKEAKARLRSAQETLKLKEEGFRPEDVAQGKANLLLAKAVVEQAETRRADAKLFAPSDGVIMTRVVEPGTILGAGSIVYTLSLTGTLYIRAYVPEPELSRVKPGTEVEVRTDTPGGRTYHGQVGFISPEAEFTPKNVETPDLRTQLVFRLRIVVTDADDGLRQGMPVTVRLIEEATQ